MGYAIIILVYLALTVIEALNKSYFFAKSQYESYVIINLKKHLDKI